MSIEMESGTLSQKQNSKSSEDRYLGILGLAWDSLKDKHVLDIGAGDGSFARAAHSHGVSVVSLDNNRRRWDAAHRDGFQTPLVLVDMAHLSSELKPGAFDLVVSVASLYSEEDAKRTLPEVFTVLKRGGEFRAAVNYSEGFIKDLSDRTGFSSSTFQKIAEPWKGFYIILRK